MEDWRLTGCPGRPIISAIGVPLKDSSPARLLRAASLSRLSCSPASEILSRMISSNGRVRSITPPRPMASAIGQKEAPQPAENGYDIAAGPETETSDRPY